jgi:hypothetical protein
LCEDLQGVDLSEDLVSSEKLRKVLLEELGIDRRITLKRILKRRGVSM